MHHIHKYLVYLQVLYFSLNSLFTVTNVVFIRLDCTVGLFFNNLLRDTGGTIHLTALLQPVSN
jgi:hypothetical protein